MTSHIGGNGEEVVSIKSLLESAGYSEEDAEILTKNHLYSVCRGSWEAVVILMVLNKILCDVGVIVGSLGTLILLPLLFVEFLGSISKKNKIKQELKEKHPEIYKEVMSMIKKESDGFFTILLMIIISVPPMAVVVLYFLMPFAFLYRQLIWYTI